MINYRSSTEATRIQFSITHPFAFAIFNCSKLLCIHKEFHSRYFLSLHAEE